MVTLMICLAAPAVSQELQHLMIAVGEAPRSVTMTAVQIVRQQSYPAVVRLTGKVEIRTPVCLPPDEKGARICDGDMVVRAEEATVNEQTGEIEARGNVRVTPLQHAAKAN